ncbi:MAG: cache domain-containing protein, partial [Ruminiclostridium sp.]|nr:cache domain-containing protein [Ruminiclostridium sp.]
MLRQSDTGVKILRSDLDDETTRLKNIADYWDADNIPAKAIGLRRYFSLEESWTLHKATESDFCALFDASGELLWQTENYALSNYNPSASIGGNTVSGIYADKNVPLSLIYVKPTVLNGTTNGAILLGTDLSRSERLDATSEKSGGEVTLFAGKTRYATTIKKADGTRAIGTDMSAKVETAVIQN